MGKKKNKKTAEVVVPTVIGEYPHKHTDVVDTNYNSPFRTRSYGAIYNMCGWYVIGTRWDCDPKSARVRVICPAENVNIPIKGLKTLDDPNTMQLAYDVAQAYIAEMNSIYC